MCAWQCRSFPAQAADRRARDLEGFDGPRITQEYVTNAAQRATACRQHALLLQGARSDAFSSLLVPLFPIDHRRPGSSHDRVRSEEHTPELQSRLHLACRLLPEK